MWHWYLPILVVFACILTCIQCVQLDEEAQCYLKEVVKQFSENPTDRRYDHVVEPPADRPYLPALFLWAPLEHFKFTMKCLKHPTCNLRTAGWTDDLLSKRSNKNPRLIFDLKRNIILVQRLYTCRRDVNHHYMAASVELMSNFPVCLRPNHFPYKKYHMSVASFDLIDYIFSQVIHRLSFSQISESISAMNFAYFQRTIGFNEKNFHENVLFSFPSRDKVQSIFLDTYYSVKQLLESTRSLPSTSISIDHSYKIGRSYSEKVKKEPMRIFTILNENHEIVSWKPTQGNYAEEFMPLLMELKYKLDVTGTSLTTVYLENCCEMRETYTNLFPGVSVKLDPFHAFQSIIECLPDKKVVHACIFAKDLRRIIRSPGDNDDKREMETATPSIIMRNLMDVLNKQDAFLNSLPEAKKTQIMSHLELLKEHIIMGCLSYIPPDSGSGAIEKYYQEFMKNDNLHNKYFILSPELAVAIFAVLCAAYNSRSNIRKHSCNIKIVPYLPKTYTSPFLQKPEDPEALSIDDFALFSSGNIMTNNMLSLLAYDIYYVYNFLKKIKHLCFSDAFNIEKAVKLVVNSCRIGHHPNQESTEHDHDYNTEHKEKLLNNLKQFNLTIDTIPSDGDCLFRSILMQVFKTLSQIEPWHPFTQQVERIGLRSTVNEEELILILRQLFVNEIKTEERYRNYLTNEDISDLDSFSLPGVYASNIGDLVVDVCTDLLGIPIVVIASFTDMDVSIHLPKTKQFIDTPLMIAYNAAASGHYDGTKPLSQNLTAGGQNESDLYCRCGGKRASSVTCVNNVSYSSRCPCRNKGINCNAMCHCRLCGNSKPNVIKSDSVFCRCGESKSRSKDIPTDEIMSCTMGKRATKCPCFNSNGGCSADCKCIGCANDFGIRPEKIKSDKPAVKIKRKRQDKTYSRPKMSDFSFDDDPSLQEVENGWTLEEIATVLCSVNLMLRFPGSNITAETIHLIYTSARESYALNNMGLKLNMRTVEQIDEKMKELNLIDLFPVTYIVEHIEVGQNDVQVQLENGQTVQLDNSHTVQLENSQSVQFENGQTIQLDNGQTVQLENTPTAQLEDEQTVQLDSQSVELDHGQTIQLENGQTIQLENGQTIQLENGQTFQLKDGQIQIGDNQIQLENGVQVQLEERLPLEEEQMQLENAKLEAGDVPLENVHIQLDSEQVVFEHQVVGLDAQVSENKNLVGDEVQSMDSINTNTTAANPM